MDLEMEFGLMCPRPPIIDFAYGVMGLIIFVGVILGSAVIVWGVMPTLVGWLL